MDKRLGLFSEQEAEVNPLAVYEGCSIEAKPPFVAPHHHWVQVSSYCRHVLVQVATGLLRVAIVLGPDMMRSQPTDTRDFCITDA